MSEDSSPPPDESLAPTEPDPEPRDDGLFRWFFRRVLRASSELGFYRRPLGESWRRAALYFAGLWLLLGLCLGGVEGYRAWSETQRIGEDLQRQMPTVLFRNGDLEVQAEVPYRMTVQDRHRVILDPEASLNRQKLDADVVVVVVDGYLYVRQSPDRFRAISTRVSGRSGEEEATVLDAGTVREMLPTVKVVIAGLTLLIFLLMEGIRLLTWLLVVSGAGLLVAGMRYNLEWDDVLKLTCYAITPVGLLDVFLYTIDLIPMYSEFVYTGLGLGWLTLIMQRLDGRDLGEPAEPESPPTA